MVDKSRWSLPSVARALSNHELATALIDTLQVSSKGRVSTYDALLDEAVRRLRSIGTPEMPSAGVEANRDLYRRGHF